MGNLHRLRMAGYDHRYLLGICAGDPQDTAASDLGTTTATIGGMHEQGEIRRNADSLEGTICL